MFQIVLYLIFSLSLTFNVAIIFSLLERKFGKIFRSLSFVRDIETRARLLLMIVGVAFRSWLAGTIVRRTAKEFEVRLVIDGELVRLILVKRLPEVVDVQNDETDESFFTEKVEQLTRYEQKKWTVPPGCSVFFGNGTASSKIVEL